MGDIVVGTCSWTDKTMVERWYPDGVSSAEQRLRYYAARFDSVEVDSAFYAIPKPEYAVNWAKRTPPGFTFHVKAYGMMTGHEVDERALHPDLAEGGYNYEITSRGRVRMPEERMVEHATELFLESVEPLVEAGKMGGVLMQYPPWFTAKDREKRERNLATIEHDAEMLAPLPVFVEFRHASWVEGSNLKRTMQFLSERGPHVRVGRRAADSGLVGHAADHRGDGAPRVRAAPRAQPGHVERAHGERGGSLRLPLHARRARRVASADARSGRVDRAHVGHVQQLQVRLRAPQRA